MRPAFEFLQHRRIVLRILFGFLQQASCPLQPVSGRLQHPSRILRADQESVRRQPVVVQAHVPGKDIRRLPGHKGPPARDDQIVEQNERTIAAVSTSGIFAFILTNFSRLWQWLLWLFGFSKRKKWGTVYDSVTKYPLDPAYVVAMDMTGRKVAESITDLDGRYGFILQPGTYKIVASKTNYKFPSERLARMPVDEVYDDLYFGEVITINDKEQVILKNIPMDPTGYDWNQAEKQRAKLGKYSREIRARKFFGTIFYIGFAISLILFAISPSLWNFAILASYVVLAPPQAVRQYGGQQDHANQHS